MSKLIFAFLLCIVLLCIVMYNREGLTPAYLPQRRGVIIESGLNATKVYTLPNAIEAK